MFVFRCQQLIQCRQFLGALECRNRPRLRHALIVFVSYSLHVERKLVVQRLNRVVPEPVSAQAGFDRLVVERFKEVAP